MKDDLHRAQRHALQRKQVAPIQQQGLGIRSQKPGRRAQAQPRPSCCARNLAGYTGSMRLTDAEKAGIGWAAREVLPHGSRVLLFGSRTDDSRRGGDIDLLVEPPVAVDPAQEIALCSRLSARLYRRIGERRIDIVVVHPGIADNRLVVAEARRQGIELVQT